ncbi:MAG: histidinol dehydrogenase [Ginsengibacter sp.]
MDIKNYTEPARSLWNKLIERPESNATDITDTVSHILLEVKLKGHEAVVNFNEKFGGTNESDIKVGEEEIESGSKLVSKELKNAIKSAKENIEKFHRAQVYNEPIVNIAEGIKCWRKSLPIEKVGLYIPGGTAPLFSTLLMLGVPALIAGCKEIIVCSPPNQKGSLHPAILYTAHLLGLKNVYKTGGVQAIGAMAYGTSVIPKVYKIFGPGNQYVTAAKKMVNLEGVAIDMPAGPSEVAVYADQTSDASFVASDLLSQAEHGMDSQVVLVCSSTNIANHVINELQIQLPLLPRKDIAFQSLSKSQLVVLNDVDTAFDFLNNYAPEHLIIATDTPEKLAGKVTTAGSVFLGHYSPESAGDYASGTNHTLPTNAYARSYSGVSVDSFVKKITFQQLTRDGLDSIGKAVELMASAEGLDAHKNAISIRLNSKRK